MTQIVVVTENDVLAEVRELATAVAMDKLRAVVVGGPTRQSSVAAGLNAIAGSVDAVAIHDGARPLVNEADVRAAMALVRPGRAAVLATPITDTIKEVAQPERRVVRTLDRSRLWAAQTPQLAMLDDMRRAHDEAREHGHEATDDVALLEAIGIEVVVVPSSSENFKVTYPADLVRARTILEERAPR